MGFTDMMTSGRGPGVIGMVMALFVLLGFGFLFLFATDEGAMGDDLSIEALIARQEKEILSLQHNVKTSGEQLERAPELARKARELATLERDNQRRTTELEGLESDVAAANEAVAQVAGRFEDYKNQYREFVRNGAKGEHLDEIVTTDGSVYRDVTIREVSAVGMQIRHAEGYKRIPFEVLPENLQDRFQFDAKQKDEAIALEQKQRLEHESAVAMTEEEMARLRQAELEEKQRQAEVNQRRRIAQLHADLREMDRKIVAMDKAIQAETMKKLSRAPQMRQQQAALKKKHTEMLRELATLESGR